MRFAFRREVFTRPQLFLDKTRYLGLFCASEIGDPEKDFGLRFTALGLKGVELRCVASY
jgi:hypothetical protein